jgi:hypothetical protein
MAHIVHYILVQARMRRETIMALHTELQLWAWLCWDELLSGDTCIVSELNCTWDSLTSLAFSGGCFDF